MGYVEETGAAQHLRDARIATIYEGTNGIHGIDLVTRKLPLAGGATVKTYLAELRDTVSAVKAVNDPVMGAMGARLGEAVDSLERTTAWLMAQLGPAPEAALAGATPYLRLFALAAGGCALATDALAARADGNGAAGHGAPVSLARFFAENVAVLAPGLERTVVEGAASVNDTQAALAS
jgi:hypothetical protein